MGWTGHNLKGGYVLFTRGGFNGVYISHKDDEKLSIEIPEELLARLAADTIRSKRISNLEDMTDEQVLGL